MKKKLKNLESVLMIGIGLLALWYFTRHTELLCMAGILILMAAISEKAAILIGRIWQKTGDILGFISSKLLLTIVYYFILTPISMISRLFRRDFLVIHKKPKDTNFVQRNYQYETRDIENPW